MHHHDAGRGRYRRLSTEPPQHEASPFLEFEDDITWDGDPDEGEQRPEGLDGGLVPPAIDPVVPSPRDQDAVPAPVPTSRGDEFVRRIVAFLTDCVLVFVVNVVAWAIAGDLTSQIAGIAASAVYFTYFEGRPGGQTLGKRWMGLRVVDLGGRDAIGYPRALLRWAGRIVAIVPAGLGCAWMLWDRGRQTWHDKMAGTVVARIDPPS